MIHAVMMQVRAVPSPARGDAFREHFDNGIESFAREIAIWVRALDQGEEVVFVPTTFVICFGYCYATLFFFGILGPECPSHTDIAGPCGTRGHDLLGENIQGRIRDY